MSDIEVSTAIDPGFSHYVIFVFSVCGIGWGAFNAMRVSDLVRRVWDLLKLVEFRSQTNHLFRLG